jgi:hypothetical protein
LWHEEYLARFLTFCALRFNRAEYFEAWEQSHRGRRDRVGGDHSFAQVLQFIPWLQAKLWQVSVGADGLQARPAWFGPKTPKTGTAFTPYGPVDLAWSATAEPTALSGANVDFLPTGTR